MTEPGPHGFVIDWSVPPAGLETIVNELRALRVAAGQPSYAEIVRRVTARREARGVPEHERRLGRTTIYDCFRSGRRRIDVDLIVEVAAALGLPRELWQAWAARCRAAQGVADASAVVMTHPDMPVPVAEFVGRQAELDALAAVLAKGSVIAWIDGMPGAGKTQLALRLAQRLRQDHGPGGVFLDLRGHRDGAPPVEPEAAQAALLRHLGVQEYHSLDAPQRTAALHDKLTASQTLLVLDDARDEDQVARIVGENGTGTVIVSSRARPEVLAEGMTVLTLGGLDGGESVELLRRLAGSSAVDVDPSSAWRLTEALGHLPLAVSLVASRLGAYPGWELADHVALIEQRLAQSRIDDELQATLALSFSDLPADMARLLRLTAQAPLHGVDADAAAALAEVPPEQANRMLTALVHRNLVISRGTDRVTLHALVRAYAHGQAEEIDAPRVRDAAFARVARHYADRVWAAYAVLARRAGEEPRRTRFRYQDVGWSAEAAESWLTINLDNLLSTAHAAPARGQHELLFHMSEGLSWWLNLTGRYREAIRLHEAAADVAATSGHAEALATASLDVSQIYANLGRTREALEHLRRATRLAGNDLTHGDATDPGIGGLLFNMTAIILVRRGEVTEAIDCLRRAVDIHEKLGETSRLLSCLVNLGVALHTVGRFTEEHSVVDRGVRTAEAGDHSLMLALFLVNRSSLHNEMGEPERALTDATRALDLASKIGYALVIAEAQANIGSAHRLRGDLKLALAHATRAVDVARRADDHHLMCQVLLTLARVHLAAGDEAALRRTLAEAEEMSHRSDDPLLAARVTRMYGDAAHDAQERTRRWREALDVFDRLSAPDAHELRRALEHESVRPRRFDSRPFG